MLKFASETRVDAVSQSFVESKADITAVRELRVLLAMIRSSLLKIERSRALDHMDGILQEADSIMIARAGVSG